MKQVFSLIMLALLMAACGGSSGSFRMSNTPVGEEFPEAQIPDFDFTDSGPLPDMDVPYPTEEPEEASTTTTTTSTSTSTTVRIVTTTTIKSPKIASTTTTSTTTTTLPEEIVVTAPPNPKKEKPVENEFDPTSVVASATKEDFVGFNTLSPTVYYIAKVDENAPEYTCNAEEKRSVLRKNTSTNEVSEIIKLCPKAFDKCKLEGTCLVIQGDKKIPLNYHYYDKTDLRSYWVIIDVKKCAFGYGVKNSCLDPYYTLAADLNIYKPGDVIFVPALVGVDMGNGKKHHGFFIIRDQGRGIIGRGRFDFFTGYQTNTDSKNLFKKFKLGDVNTKLKYYLVKNPSKLNKFIKDSRNYPNLPK